MIIEAIKVGDNGNNRDLENSEKRIFVFRRKGDDIKKDFKLIQSISCEKEEVEGSLAPEVSPDSKFIAHASAENRIRLLEYNRGTKEYARALDLEGHQSRITNLKFSPGSLLLASVSEDCKLIIKKRKSTSSTEFSILQEIDLKNRKILYIEFSQDRELLVLGTNNGDLYVLKRKPNDLIYHIFRSLGVAKNSKNRSISLSRDGSTLTRTSKFEIYDKDGEEFKLSVKYKRTLENASKATQTDSEYILGNSKGEIRIMSKNYSNFFGLFLSDFYFSGVLCQALDKKSLKSTLDYIYTNAFDIIKPEEGYYEDFNEHRRISCLLNPLFWLSSFSYPKQLKDLLASEKFHYDARIYHGNEHFDPFLVALKANDDEILDTWAAYFQKNPDRLVIRDNQMLVRLLESGNSKIQDLGLKRVVGEPELGPGVDLSTK